MGKAILPCFLCDEPCYNVGLHECKEPFKIECDYCKEKFTKYTDKAYHETSSHPEI